MRILHFADLHLGVETYGRIDPATGLNSRLLDFLGVLDRVVEAALEGDIDLVLFCGDAYKSRRPDPTEQREFARRIGKLASQGIPVFLLVGNHDLPNALGRATAVEIFDTLAIKNVHVASVGGTYRVATRRGLLQIVALPWIRRSTFLAQEESKNLPLDQLNERLQEKLTHVLEAQIQGLDPGLPAVLAAHVSLDRAKPSSERSMIVGREHVLLQSNVASPAFSYVALGHIHRHQVLGHQPPVVYSGSLERLDFSEEGDEKGFCIVEIEGKEVADFRFHPVPARRFLTIKLHLDSQEQQPMARVLKAIQRQRVKDAIVRVDITITQGESGIEEREIQKALREAHYVVPTAIHREEQPRTRLVPEAAEKLTPLEALKVYLESRETPPHRLKQLLEYGEKLLRQAEEKA